MVLRLRQAWGEHYERGLESMMRFGDVDAGYTKLVQWDLQSQ